MPGFSYNLNNGVGFYTIDEFERTGKVKTCFSSRNGGVSKSKYFSLNVGYKTSDDRINIHNNISILCKAVGFEINDLVLSDQVHGDRCRVVSSSDRGKGVIRESDISGVDALVTNCKDIAICIFTADCVPVYLLDIENNVAALCHAGWRGVINEIVLKTIDVMKVNFKSKPGNIIAAIAPSIGPCCFEVGYDVARVFQDYFENTKGIYFEEKGHFRINLWNAVAEQLIRAGINSNVVNSELCTCCNSDAFYSYRRDGFNTGRMASIMKLK